MGDKNNESMMEALRVFASFLLIGMVLVMLACMASCSTSKPRVEYLTETRIERSVDTIFRDRVSIRVDSVIINRESSISRRDSVAPILDSLNRVIGFDRWHFEKVVESSEAERARLLADIDSLREVAAEERILREPYPVEVEVEVNRLRWWQRALMWVGGLALIGGILITTHFVRRTIKNDKRIGK